MKTPKPRLCRRRVGVVGLYRSGKTVFLTSLINHLRNHRPARFALGKNARLVFTDEQAPSRFDPFPYARHRDSLVAAEDWPGKTRGASEYRCRFYRSDWNVTRGEISLLDFPGERLADLLMAEASFESWSDLVLAIFRENSEYRAPAQDYLKMQEDGQVSEKALLDAYKKLLAHCFLSYRPVITPSSVLLSPGGAWHGDALRGNDGVPPGCFAGLDAESQFAPLAPGVRHRRPDLAKRFERRYRGYRRKIALPLAEWMRGCDTLVVLLDVTALLSGGEAMYQGNRELLRHLIGMLKPGRGFFGLGSDALMGLLAPWDNRPLKPLADHKLWPSKSIEVALDALRPWVKLRWNAISRIAFVATKADKVLAPDRDHLTRLVREMTEDLIARRELEAARLEVEYFACAAVNSTRTMDSEHLQAYLGPDRQAVVFTPSPVPENWPQTWQEGQFSFPNVRPWMPPLRDTAPDHIELDRIADFILR